MIATDMAQKFVDRFCATIRYNVNVMDPDGIIIAARDTHRIGTYHEVAHALVLSHRDEGVVRDGTSAPPGVLPGVNLLLRHRGEVVGVVGVTGDAPDVDNVAHTVRTAIEAMLEYEWERAQLDHRKDRNRLLIDLLVHREDPDPRQLSALAARCGYDAGLARMPVVLETPAAASPHDYLGAVRACVMHTKQDIVFIGDSGHITVFKTVPRTDSGVISEMRRGFLSYCDAVDAACIVARQETPIRYTSGPIHTDPVHYRASLRTALWILHRTTARSAFFFDYTGDLLLHSIAPEVWHTVFDHIAARLGDSSLVDQSTLEQLGETFLILCQENMSAGRAAERLGVHRNTVLSRLGRLNELTGLDPSSRWRDRRTLQLFFEFVLRRLSQTTAHDGRTFVVPIAQNSLV